MCDTAPEGTACAVSNFWFGYSMRLLAFVGELMEMRRWDDDFYYTVRDELEESQSLRLLQFATLCQSGRTTICLNQDIRFDPDEIPF